MCRLAQTFIARGAAHRHGYEDHLALAASMKLFTPGRQHFRHLGARDLRDLVEAVVGIVYEQQVGIKLRQDFATEIDAIHAVDRIRQLGKGKANIAKNLAGQSMSEIGKFSTLVSITRPEVDAMIHSSPNKS